MLPAWLRPSPEPEPEPPEATWSEFVQLYLEKLKCVHVSQYDREEKPSIYLNVPSDTLSHLLRQLDGEKPQTNGQPEPEQTDADGQDPTQTNTADIEVDYFRFPITVLTSFYIQTHQGMRLAWPLPSAPCHANTLTLF